MKIVHFGQNWDISWHHGNHVPSTEEYLQMAAYKTGVLPRLVSKLVWTKIGSSETSLDTFCERIGVAF